MWLRGIGCFLYNTPEMVRVRDVTKFRVRLFGWNGFLFFISNAYSGICIIHINYFFSLIGELSSGG